jgi:hypothetical protein
LDNIPQCEEIFADAQSINGTPRRCTTKDYTNKNVLLQELSRLVVSTHNVREKNDVLKSIAAIMQMNKEQSDDEKELIHFYLPITCKRCSLYVKELEDKKSGQTK